MAKAAAAKSDTATPAAKRDTIKITYMPGDDDRPVTTCWGVTFRAHLPVEVPKALAVEVDTPHRIDMPDGTSRTVTKPTRIPAWQLAKDNPFFAVEGFPRAKRVVPTVIKDGKRVKATVPPPGAEWAGTNRDEMLSADQMNYPDDFDPNAAAIVIDSREEAA